MYRCRPLRTVLGSLGAVLLAALAACTAGSSPRPQPGQRASPGSAWSWESRLTDDAIVLLGEVHDNAGQHRMRLAILERALAAGWRPAIAMEQLDREHQADIDRARIEFPHDAPRLLERAAADRSGWNWQYYRPFVELALRYDVPLLAANLSRADASRIAHEGFAAVFDTAQLAALGLDRALPPDLERAQSAEISRGHCGALPASLLPGMVRAQLARDAWMASVLRARAAGGVVLLTGNGHARRDIGVPRWLAPAPGERVFAVGFLEAGDSGTPPAAFDAIVRTPAAAREDPCKGIRQRLRE